MNTKEELKALYKKLEICEKCKNNGSKDIDNLDKFLFLPPRIEEGKIKYLFIAMEPTDLWCNGAKEGKKLVKDGFVGFYYSKDSQSRFTVFLLHFSAQEFLCEPGETYLITDLGKCSMPTEKDNKDDLTKKTRDNRFTNCLEFLKKEIEITKPKQIFILGGDPEKKLKKYKDIFDKAKKILHYSRNNTRSGHFSKYCEKVENQKAFIDFKKNEADIKSKINKFIDVRKDQIWAHDIKTSEANRLLIMKMLDSIREKINKDGLTDDSLKRLFYYYNMFKH